MSKGIKFTIFYWKFLWAVYIFWASTITENQNFTFCYTEKHYTSRVKIWITLNIFFSIFCSMQFKLHCIFHWTRCVYLWLNLYHNRLLLYVCTLKHLRFMNVTKFNWMYCVLFFAFWLKIKIIVQQEVPITEMHTTTHSALIWHFNFSHNAPATWEVDVLKGNSGNIVFFGNIFNNAITESKCTI